MSNGALKYGERAAREVSERAAGSFESAAALQDLPPAFRVHGMLAVVMSDYSLWVFDSESDTAADDNVLVPTTGDGRWHACTLRTAS